MARLASARPGSVTIQVPQGARVYVNDVAVSMTATVQTFPTPPLQPNRDYHYSIRAGNAVTVDLRDTRSWTPPRPSEGPATASLTVKLPAQARLYVNDTLCPLTSAERKFSSPPLEKGKVYHYTLRAEMQLDGRPVVETQRVQVAAGKVVQIEFGKLFSVSTSR
jgi:uncharacterized protein (TIGR03000 family)